MQRGISYQGFLALRREPSPMAGMVSQILFGERFTILKSEGPWLLIETESDLSEGWVIRDGVQLINEAEWSEKGHQTKEMMVIHPFVRVEDTQNVHLLLLPAGSVMRSDRFVKVSDEGWIEPRSDHDPEKIGRGLLSIPGLHGGRCGFGFDAPGLVQMLCRTMGIRIPHSITGQAVPGSIINFIHEAQRGDLAFFHNGDDQFTHVGMVLNGGKIIHVSDQVRIDSLDQQGIYCEEKEKYTHQLRIIKSLKGAK